MWAWIARVWEAIKPDGYTYIAMNMELDGYSDFEISREIAAMKEADRRRKEQQNAEK
jgi:hypothetical protein